MSIMNVDDVLNASRMALRIVADRTQMQNADRESRLIQDALELKAENDLLMRKNETLRRNFQVIEKKYKELRKVLEQSPSKVHDSTSSSKMENKESKKVLEQSHSKIQDSSTGSKLEKRASIKVEKREAEQLSSVAQSSDKRRKLDLDDVQNEKPSTTNALKSEKIAKCVETVRNKSDRAALPGFTCEECKGYYGEIMRQGLITKEELAEKLKECSRHKAKCTPPDTPAGFWDDNFSMPT